jgi:hypothetical protein
MALDEVGVDEHFLSGPVGGAKAHWTRMSVPPGRLRLRQMALAFKADEQIAPRTQSIAPGGGIVDRPRRFESPSSRNCAAASQPNLV